MAEDNVRLLAATDRVISAIRRMDPKRDLTYGVPDPKITPICTSGEAAAVEYDGMFTCVDASYTDSSGNKHNDIVVTVGSSFVKGDPLADPIVPDTYDSKAGVATVNGSTHDINSIKFSDITASGYIYLKTTNDGSAGTIIMSGATVTSSDSVVILGTVTFMPADNGEDAYIIVKQVWKWEQIIDYVFATCEEITCA